MEKKYFITSVVLNILYWLLLIFFSSADDGRPFVIPFRVPFSIITFVVWMQIILLIFIFLIAAAGLIYSFLTKSKKVIIYGLLVNLVTLFFIVWSLLIVEGSR